jgi:DUF917 family protein
VRLDAAHLRDLARGCAFLGSGSGGDPDLGLVMALHALTEHEPVDVVAVDDVPDGTLVMPCGLVGAAALADERVWSGDEGRILVERVEELFGTRVGALMAFEIGGANGILPVTWAARTGLPLVDGDGMGRACSDLGRQAMRVAGRSASPVVLTDGRGNTVVLHAADEAWAERIARMVSTSLGGVCAAALFCLPAERARSSVIRGSVSRAVSVGAGRASDLVVLLYGRVVDVERGVAGSAARGSATIVGVGTAAGRHLRLELRDEFLLALEDGAVRAVAPDLISVLAADTGAPIPTERLRHGQRVSVVAAPAADVWRTGAGLALAGPTALGFDVPYATVAADG